MLCDHCATEGNELIISAYYDLQLCPCCLSRHERKLEYEKESLWELARQQEYLEYCMLNYVYEE